MLLDGLPLRLELAAARLRVLPPAAMLAHLHQHLSWLSAGAVDLPERQQTLLATLDWSYALLSAEQQRLLVVSPREPSEADLAAIIRGSMENWASASAASPGRER